MFCQECGAENQEGAKFCYKCGNRINIEAENSANIKTNEEAYNTKIGDNKKNVENEVNEHLKQTICCLGEKILFEGKYFHRKFIRDCFYYCSEKLKYEVKNTKGMDGILENLAQSLENFCRIILDRMEKLEDDYFLNEQTEMYGEITRVYKENMIDIIAAVEACSKIDQGVDAQIAYREARKATRGRWIGGGFGFSNAIKGAAQAELLNLGSGALHSAVNLFGTAVSTIKANGKKRKLIYGVRDDLVLSVEKAAEKVASTYLSVIESKYPQTFYKIRTDELNALSSKLNESTEKEQQNIVIQLFKIDPYHLERYISVFHFMLRDELIYQFHNNLYDLHKISQKFEVPFNSWLEEYVQIEVKNIHINYYNLLNFPS